ncbi:protein-disulfide reductase DsbD N-terminal domain-containing protein (plasmid) [Dyella sp. BiH032]|uniref:protein-disulfide reductase DsbD N-terminal domain-containing protein n=1 Tax=Dyella sp. BiH032 TaxID=3075430 RepID=UPI002892BAE4|nr:protein-disulfide reductase DsbD N-terminal domain-containing protein [Dyella sp. BiH032]WNL48384.1 protein-disulfide reductase DsbD N-terminal domain-containing protein [Dyella sp. BiH032]
MGHFLIAALAAAALAPLTSHAGDLLDAPEAFRVAHSARVGQTLYVTWDVEPGYAVYRERIHVRDGGTGRVRGAAQLPAGQLVDDGLGNQSEEYLDTFTMAIPLTEGAAGDISVTVQGCHQEEPQVCFQPMTIKLSVDDIGLTSPRSAG